MFEFELVIQFKPLLATIQLNQTFIITSNNSKKFLSYIQLIVYGNKYLYYIVFLFTNLTTKTNSNYKLSIDSCHLLATTFRDFT